MLLHCDAELPFATSLSTQASQAAGSRSFINALGPLTFSVLVTPGLFGIFTQLTGPCDFAFQASSINNQRFARLHGSKGHTEGRRLKKEELL